MRHVIIIRHGKANINIANFFKKKEILTSDEWKQVDDGVRAMWAGSKRVSDKEVQEVVDSLKCDKWHSIGYANLLLLMCVGENMEKSSNWKIRTIFQNMNIACSTAVEFLSDPANHHLELAIM